MIISISTHKGGVGKTATTQNLGAGLASLKKKVLLIDFDPQCNMTSRFGKLIPEDAKTILDYMRIDELPIMPVAINEYLDIIPSDDELDEASLDMAADPENETVFLQKVIERVNKECKYDYILIDTAPGSSPLMVNALVAAQEVIIPIADKDSLRGLSKLQNIIGKNKLSATPHYLITLFDSRLSSDRDIKDFLIENAPDLLLHAIIRKNEAINQAGNDGTDIFSYSPKCYGAQDYLSLAKEIIALNKKQHNHIG